MKKPKISSVEFRRLGQCFLDWATAVAGEADRELTCVTFTYHSSGPIYETSAQTTKFAGTVLPRLVIVKRSFTCFFVKNVFDGRYLRLKCLSCRLKLVLPGTLCS